jgi:hypothetical protein
MKGSWFVLALALAASAASAALVDTRIDTTPGGAAVDGSIGANEYGPANVYSYTGGGGGFGGTLGAGTLHLESDLSNLYIGFQPANPLNDNVVILLDTRSGGFFDADMNDTADPGRNLSSNLTRDVDDVFPFPADYSIVIGSFGIVVFELNAGNTSGHLAFVQFDGTFTGNDPGLAREIAIPLSSLASPAVIDFFVGYGSNDNYMSDESIPTQSFNGGGNLGYDNNGTFQPVNWANYNRFVVIPEPATGLLLLAGLIAFSRRRRV